MIDLSRRSFFRLAIGAALTPVSAKAAAILPSVAVLYSDGTHCDSPAIRALIAGDVVEFARPQTAKGAGWLGNALRFPVGTYRIDEPITITPDRMPFPGVGMTVIFDDCVIVVADNLRIWADIRGKNGMGNTLSVQRARIWNATSFDRALAPDPSRSPADDKPG